MPDLNSMMAVTICDRDLLMLAVREAIRGLLVGFKVSGPYMQLERK